MKQLTVKNEMQSSAFHFFLENQQQADFSEWQMVKVKTVDKFDSGLLLIYYYKWL